MEFSGQYLTFNEYKAMGGTLDQTPFDILEFEARKKVDERTQSRLKGRDNIPQEVKMCVLALINSLERYINNKNSKNISSENTDGYSISYLTAQEMVSSKNVELNDIITTYLTGVIVNNEHILYLGV